MNNNIIGHILSGWKSSRMNFINKSFLKVNNESFIQIIINTLSQRLDTIYINANQDLEKYKKLNTHWTSSNYRIKNKRQT